MVKKIIKKLIIKILAIIVLVSGLLIYITLDNYMNTSKSINKTPNIITETKLQNKVELEN